MGGLSYNSPQKLLDCKLDGDSLKESKVVPLFNIIHLNRFFSDMLGISVRNVNCYGIVQNN